MKDGFWARLLAALKKMLRTPESSCGKCGVCHHVCRMLESSKKGGN